jgi:DNA (cytosine-5)-methyltransferase 1
MTHGSLFSGIGGFDLAAEWMGWENKFHCEWNPFGQKVLKHYWPEAESFTDITKSNFEKYAGTIDVLSGGFPCQPYSTAGKRLGKADERHLWPEMLRAIREIKPTYIVGENVRGLLNWNGGMVFEEVCAQLEDIGYQVAPFVIPACGVGAPHRRERIFIVAYSDSNGQHQRNGNYEINTSKSRINAQRNVKQSIGDGFVTNGDSIGQKSWENFPTVAPICNGNDGISDRLDGITFYKWRSESIKGGGNAICPQVAYQIFKTIQKQNHDLYSMQAHNA